MNPAQTNPFTIWTVSALIVSTAVVIVLGYLVNRTITQPLSQLARLARRIEQGDTSARVHISGRNEIAVVAASINRMLDQIVRLLRETQGQRDELQGPERPQIQVLAWWPRGCVASLRKQRSS